MWPKLDITARQDGCSSFQQGGMVRGGFLLHHAKLAEYIADFEHQDMLHVY
jgi:hypothetical protein